MQIENETQHYRARFDVFPYESTSSAFPEVAGILWGWAQRKESRRRTELGKRLSSKAGKADFIAGKFTFPKD